MLFNVQAGSAVQQNAGGHLAAASSPTSGVPSSSGEQSVAKRESAAEKERVGASAGITPTPPEHPFLLQVRNVIPKSGASLRTTTDAKCMSQL